MLAKIIMSYFSIDTFVGFSQLVKIPITINYRKQARALSVDRLLYAIDQIDDLKYRALFLLMYRGGFRISEIVSICPGDLRIDNDFLIVTLDRSKTGEQIRRLE